MIGTRRVYEYLMQKRRRAVATMLALGLLTLTAPAAFAAGPVHSQDTLTWDDEVVAECGGFDVLSTSNDLRRNLVTWYDESGGIVQQIRQVHYDFTLVNTVTGTTGEYVGHFVIAQDSAAQTLSLSGADSQLWVDGRLVLRVAGRTVFTPDGMSVRGLSSRDAFGESLCDAMA
jgi:hypothetical protein